MSIRLKLLLTFSLLFTVVFGLLFWSIYTMTSDLALESLRRELVGTAQLAANKIDGDMHAHLVADGKEDDAAYRLIATWLREIQSANSKIGSIYTMVLSDDPNELRSVVTADPSEDRLRFMHPYSIADAPQMRDAFTHPTSDQTIEHDAWGAWFSGYAPIYDSNNKVVAIVGVDMTAREVLDLQQQILLRSVGFFAAVYVLLIATVWFVSTHVTRPLQVISKAATALERGEPYSPPWLADVKDRSDEVGLLARVFDKMAVEVQAREQSLKQEVTQLRIEIDEVKQNRQVAEITESDFFRDLQAKASRMRTKADRSALRAWNDENQESV